MSKQLNIFDLIERQEIETKIAYYQRKLKAENQALETLDPNDHEDRNEMRACRNQIQEYDECIKRLQQQLSEKNR